MLIQFHIAEALSSPLLRPVPEAHHIPIRQIKQFVAHTEKQHEKCHSALLFKICHKLYLMRMNVLQGKRIGRAFFRIKADWHSLHSPNIIDRTFLFKIGQCNMAMLFVDLKRSDRRRDLLDQGKSFSR